jgi:hypothetical protein
VQWAADLMERWESTRSMRKGRRGTIAWEDVISVDAQGADVLLEMAAQISRRPYSARFLGELPGGLFALRAAAPKVPGMSPSRIGTLEAL